MKEKTSMRQIARLAAATALAFSYVALALAQPTSWPTKPVRLISPYAAGGSNDATTRIVADRLTQRLGQQFIVENRAGANTRIATEAVAKASPDGYTLMMAAAPFAINNAFYDKLPYDVLTDFVPIVLTVIGPVFLVVHDGVPAKNVNEFVAYVKANPGKVVIGSPGNASGPHLTIALFMQVAGINALHVPYKGDAPLYTELLGGRIDALITALTTGLGHIKSGKLKVLAVASENRSPLWPSAPTFAEEGFPGVVGYGWFGLVAQKGTPPEIVRKLNTEVNAILGEPDTQARLETLALQRVGGSPEDFARFIREEIAKWTKVVKEGNIKAE
jgi:tripartite-type tricarboxylate transporter receptor subunit TctC